MKMFTYAGEAFYVHQLFELNHYYFVFFYHCVNVFVSIHHAWGAVPVS